MEGMVGVAAPLVAALVDLDATYFIQMGLFLVLYVLLSLVFFGPYTKRLRRRDASSLGLREHAKDALRRARDLDEDAERKMAEARQAAVAERRRLAEEGAGLRDSIVRKERERMQARVDEELVSLQALKDRFLAGVEPAAEELSQVIEAQVRSVEAR
jgi:F-type H+-transporting ATPase subunit b